MLPPSLSPPPPPPPRRINWVKDGNEEEEVEEIKEMVGGDSSTINESIPDELLFEILLRLPAQDIYFAARLVCRKWYDMTRTNYFVRKHLECASYGLLYTDGSENPVFISARDGGGIETYKINFQFNSDYNATIPSFWPSTWNGLMLEYHESVHKKLGYYNVKNVLTGQTFRLPRFPYFLQYHWLCGIGYDAASMRYKVVSFKRLEFEWAILTVGVDKSWRTVCTDHLSSVRREYLLYTPIITEGFMHWTRLGGSSDVVTLNLETETFAETPPPITEVEANFTQYCYFSTGRYLSTFIRRGQLVWEALEMKPETGEWRKLGLISLEGKKENIERLEFKHDDVYIRPWGWLKYPDVLAFRVQRKFIVFYNLITGEIGTEKLSFTLFNFWITLHKNSLVSF